MGEKKAYPLRISAPVLDAMQRWANDELRSLNAQIEYILREALQKNARLKPPHWRALPPAAAYGDMYQQDRDAALRSARLAARLTAADLASIGINIDCTPVLDVLAAGSHGIIGALRRDAGPRTRQSS